MKITGTAILRDYHRANDFQAAAEVTDSGTMPIQMAAISSAGCRQEPIVWPSVHHFRGALKSTPKNIIVMLATSTAPPTFQ
ncbi:hypothetical protein [Thiolapillus sp.]|uniref:hypothetical protein n=1 Tax=Thiolapillus sp. TaxID=2017437 RepID=UPI003AF51638